MDRPSAIRRSHSFEHTTSYIHHIRNSNISWVDNAFIIPTYVLFVLMFHFLVSKNITNTISFPWTLMQKIPHVGGFMPVVEDSDDASASWLPLGGAWGVTNFFHAIFSFIGMHWVKGSPNYYDQGEMNGLTWYEQLKMCPKSDGSDGARGFSGHVKRMMVMCIVFPACLCLVSLRESAYAPIGVFFNLIFLGFCVVPKLDSMHGVRLFGINDTVGIEGDGPTLQGGGDAKKAPASPKRGGSRAKKE